MSYPLIPSRPAALCGLGAALLFLATPSFGVTRTAMSMDVYGYLDQLVEGDLITVQDPDGVECGRYEVSTDGRYGFLHVYGDDPLTSEDEGARPGDTLSFYLNGVAVEPLGGPVVWEGDLVSRQVDLSMPTGVGVASTQSGGGGGSLGPAMLFGLCIALFGALSRRRRG